MKIGYCCKFKPTQEIVRENRLDKKGTKDIEERYNLKSTTIKSLRSLSKSEAFDKITKLVVHNISALENQISWVSRQPKEMRLLRIGSEFVPAATHPEFRWIFHHPTIHNMLEQQLGEIGRLARHHEIRLTFHPGQFCVLNSINEETVKSSIEEFEYHTTLATMLGYGSGWHDHGFAINVHAGGKQGGLESLVKVVNNRLSKEARNLITIENDEFSWGLDDLITIKEHAAIVLDIHHHFINTGEYILRDDPRIESVKESWRGTRPLGHLSTSPESVLENHCENTKPDLQALVESGIPKTKLRAHSDYCWNNAVNEWARGHLEWMDIEVEAKQKNLASKQLYEHVFGN